VDEDVAAVVSGDESETLFGVVPLDLAGRHGTNPSRNERMRHIKTTETCR
jgi:hypothetical protein